MITDDSQTPSRWDRLIDFLSLDVVCPFFCMMGVVPEPTLEKQQSTTADDLLRVLRHQIVGARKRAADDPYNRRPTAQEAIDAISQSLGEATAKRLLWWNHHVLRWGSTPGRICLNRWDRILRHCRRHPPRWVELGLPAGVEPEHFRRAHNLDDYERTQAEIDAHPLSDWDLHIYALRLYDDNLYLDDPYRVPDGPRLYTEPTIRAYRVYQFWAWVLHAMPPDARDNLWRAAVRIAHQDELDSDPDTLPHPSTLEIWT